MMTPTRSLSADGPADPKLRAAAGPQRPSLSATPGQSPSANVAEHRPQMAAAGDAETAPCAPEPVEVWYDYPLGLLQRMALLFGLYTFSIGPMYWQWYAAKQLETSPWLIAFYEPLHRLARRVPWFGEWLDFYISLWGDWKF